MASTSTPPRVLIYLLRRDLRVADNPILHELASRRAPFTHLLPLYVFPAQQVEVSGFLAPSGASAAPKSPFPEARSQVGRFWRCGPHRARFLAQSVWAVKEKLEGAGSGLLIRVGLLADVTEELMRGLKESGTDVAAVWMTSEEGVEERREERDVRSVVSAAGKQFKLWADEKYYIDDRDLPCKVPKDIPDVFTSFRKSVEPLREQPRAVLPRAAKLPPMPPAIPAGPAIFAIPDNLPDLEAALLAPLNAAAPELKNAPTWPEGTESAHPFVGGETAAHDRIRHLVTAGAMSRYKDTRNGLLGTDFSTKLSAWLALGCITARQVHRYLLDFEDGKTPLGADGAGKAGHGRGENKGTASVRFELLWRDYMRLCTRKFGHRLFRAEGFRNEQGVRWKYPEDNAATASAIQRFLCGRTGTGLIDASQRELFLTGYTSNRARQNVASFLAKHMGVDWRIGAEWYEYLLADYDVSSNWGNWQYVAGVGNDPRMSTPSTGPDQSAGRVFNPVKQAFDYDSGGAYVRAWIPELRSLGYDAESLNTVFQAWKLSPARKQEMQLDGVDWVDRPLVRIPYSSNRRAGGGGGGGGGDGSGSSNRGRGGRNNHRRGGKNSKWSENADRSIR